MRKACALVLIPVLAACEAQPAPAPEPVLPSPVLAAAETDRREHLAGMGAQGDFKVKFGEPFITFENRGARLAIARPNANPDYVVIDAARSTPEEGVTVFTGESALVDPDAPFVLTVEEGACRSRFSGERTRYVAYLGAAQDPRRWQSCASPAR